MKFKIVHDTEYLYQSDVFLEPHYFRFKPRPTSYLTLEYFNLSILVEPVGRREILDEENNTVEFCWFSGMTNKLNIRAESMLDSQSFNPLDFLLDPLSFNQLPLKYSEHQKLKLYACLRGQKISPELIHFGQAIQEASSFNTVRYLTTLNNQISADFKVVYREDGPPLATDNTFVMKEGSCRDLTWMMIHLLRYQGFAARFTSGYFYFNMEVPNYELHAWVEVFLPGCGWLGLDPSHGIVTGNMHFPIASSSHYDNTMPVSGGIRGSSASILTTELRIEKM